MKNEQRERLVELLKEIYPKTRYIPMEECREKTADYLLQNGVVVLARDGNNFNHDVYCPYCGNNLTSAKALERSKTE